MSETPSDITAAMDQMGATLRSCSAALGEYRKGLTDAGLGAATADEVVLDYAKNMHRMMCPPANPLAGLFPGSQT